MPSLVQEYLNKQLTIDEFITHRMSLDRINEAFQLMHDGKSIRAMIDFGEGVWNTKWDAFDCRLIFRTHRETKSTTSVRLCTVFEGSAEQMRSVENDFVTSFYFFNWQTWNKRFLSFNLFLSRKSLFQPFGKTTSVLFQRKFRPIVPIVNLITFKMSWTF